MDVLLYWGIWSQMEGDHCWVLSLISLIQMWMGQKYTLEHRQTEVVAPAGVAYFEEHSSISWSPPFTVSLIFCSSNEYERSILLFFLIKRFLVTLNNIHKTLGKHIHVFSLFCSLSGRSSCEATFKYQFKKYWSHGLILKSLISIF